VQVVQVQVAAEGAAMLDLDAADSQQEVDLLQGEVAGQFIFRDAVFVETSGLFACLEHDDVVTQHRQPVRARQPGRAGAHDGNRLARRRTPLERVGGEVRVVDGVALQQADLHRLALGIVIAHAGVLAQDLRRAHAGAGAAEDVLLEDVDGRAFHVTVVDVADEARHVDARRARAGAGRVVAVQAAGAFDGGLARRQRRREVREVLGQRVVRAGRVRQVVE
jgi:hypothetical protein